MATRIGGHHEWSSDIHWFNTVAGQTIKVGPNPKNLYIMVKDEKSNPIKIPCKKYLTYNHCTMKTNIFIFQYSYLFILDY